VDFGIGGNDQHRQLIIEFFEFIKQIHAAHTRHLHVRYHHVEIIVAGNFQRLGAARRGKHLKSFVAKQLGKNYQIVGFVVNYKNRMHGVYLFIK
jgi:hypothetical protein